MFTIDQSYVLQFSNTVTLLSQQKYSRLRKYTMQDSVSAEAFSEERLAPIGIGRPDQVTDILGDTPVSSQTHDRRWGYPKTYDRADFITKFSQQRQLIDPKSAYAVNHSAHMGRGMDFEILDALGGSVMVGKSSPTPLAFQSAQQVGTAVGGSNQMNIGKLLAAKEILDAAEVDPDQPRVLVYTANMMKHLLGTTQVTSVDYNSVKALVKGEIDTFLGFTFVHSELPAHSSLQISAGVAPAYVFTPSAVKFGITEEVNTTASIRNDKRNAWQLYTTGAWGAFRLDDQQVVQIAHTNL